MAVMKPKDSWNRQESWFETYFFADVLCSVSGRGTARPRRGCIDVFDCAVFPVHNISQRMSVGDGTNKQSETGLRASRWRHLKLVDVSDDCPSGASR